MKLRNELFAAVCLLLALSARADEGMWLISAPPRDQLKSRYGFEVTDAWVDHLMKSSVRMGASGSFVSADGLVLTNHHVASGQLQRLSTPEKNYARDGFLAATSADELKCPGMEISVLQSTEDVTARIRAGVPANTAPDAAAQARRKIIAELESDSLKTTGLKSEVVTLYQGAVYHLYRYKRYTDIRLVFSPESAIAAFGGDPDNFEYPRYCLDVCLFRAYENDRPARPSHYLKWTTTPVRDGDLVFVTGHPGSTDRLLTQSQVAFRRDQQVPWSLEGLRRNEVALKNWSARSHENARRAGSVLPGVENSRKANEGRIAALQDPGFMARRAEQEKSLQTALKKAGHTDALGAFDRIAEAQTAIAQIHLRHLLLEGGGGFTCSSFAIARDLLRSADERLKPNGDRMPIYSDARRASFELALFTPSPIYPDLESLRLATSLGRLVDLLGPNDPTVVQVLAGKSPRDRAAELIRGTKVRDVDVRRRLHAGGAQALTAAHDPLIELARSIDAESRQLRKGTEAQREIIHQAHAAIAQARFALLGTTHAPDATGTLRLSCGTVKGYAEEGISIPAFTDTAGLFARADAHKQREPFNLPARWLELRGSLDPTTPFNFVSTADIIGGNSGSPVVNRAGELVGLIFDGNRQSLSLGYAYDDRQARAVSVHGAIILESLRTIYDATALVEELRTGSLPQKPASLVTGR